MHHDVTAEALVRGRRATLVLVHRRSELGGVPRHEGLVRCEIVYQRTKHSPAFRAKVALAAKREQESVAEIARKYNANVVYRWKR